jgi:hypothetical protein
MARTDARARNFCNRGFAGPQVLEHLLHVSIAQRKGLGDTAAKRFGGCAAAKFNRMAQQRARLHASKDLARRDAKYLPRRCERA